MSFTRADSLKCRADFPALARTLNGVPLAYLDGPAGTQVPDRVISAISGAYSHYNANTHGQFPTSHDVDRVMERTREVIAAFLGVASGASISLGANMTTLNYALSHAIERTLKPGDEVLVTQLDHEANRAPWMRLKSAGISVLEIRLNPNGRLDEADMRAKIGPRTRLVAMGYSSNALGTVNDVELARELTRAVGAHAVHPRAGPACCRAAVCAAGLRLHTGPKCLRPTSPTQGTWIRFPTEGTWIATRRGHRLGRRRGGGGRV